MAEHKIRKVCVIGAGVMGAGIAAQVANAGVPVLLLDIVKDNADRNSLANGAVQQMKKARPAPFMSKQAAGLVETGNIEDDIARAGECDWVIEAIVERLDLKQGLYAKLDEVRKKDTIVSSNTSTIPLAQLVAGRTDSFKRNFLITHFFNPPRYMRLIELVAGQHSDAAIVGSVRNFVDRKLGKTPVDAEDSPGFIANRIGTFWMQAAVNAAFDMGVSVSDADAIAGKPMGVPKTGIFGLIDLVGVDLMPYLKQSLTGTLPADDPYQVIARDEPLIMKMIEDGYTGRKGKGGFYRLNRAGGKKVKERIDLASGDYVPVSDVAQIDPQASKGDLGALLAQPGQVGAYAWAILGPTLAYSASIVPEACRSIVGVDEAMKLGYNWKSGPFEMIDQIGAANFAARLAADDLPIPPILKSLGDGKFYQIKDGKRQYFGVDGYYHDIELAPGITLLSDIKLASQPILQNPSAALWDVGDGVACLEFTGKMNALDMEVMELIQQAIPVVSDRFEALVIYNEGSNFSAGANLGLVSSSIASGDLERLERLVAKGQDALKAFKYAPFPVVSASFGVAIGGGCEVLLNSDAVQAHAETYTGLVECGVGIIPAWGGCGEMIERWLNKEGHPKGPMPAVAKVFEIVSTATVSKSAEDAKTLGFLRPEDGITMNRDRLLADAKARALGMVQGYAPPEPPEFRLPGATGLAALNLVIDGFQARGLATEYDGVVAGKLASVLAGGEADLLDVVSEQQMLALERREFMKLSREERTQARISHMLETGKPLRN